MTHHLGSVGTTESAFIDGDAAVAHSRDVAEPTRGLGACDVVRKPARLQVSSPHLEVKRELVVDVGAEVGAPESQIPPPARPGIGDAHDTFP